MTYILFFPFFPRPRQTPAVRPPQIQNIQRGMQSMKREGLRRRGGRKTEIGTLPSWNRQTWKGRWRQKESGESFDSNPLRLSLPPFSNAYIKHIYNSVPFTSKRFAICIYIVSREKHVWCVLEGKSDSKLSFFGEYSDPSLLECRIHLSEIQTSDDIFIIRGRTHYSKKKIKINCFIQSSQTHKEFHGWTTATDITMLLSEMKNEPLAVSGSMARGRGWKRKY